MSHLGSRLSALVDGRLDPATAERMLAHVATCPACADELAAARSARAALAEAATVALPDPDPDLTARLLALHDQLPAPARPVDPFAPDGPDAAWVRAYRAGSAGAMHGAVGTGRRSLRLLGAPLLGVGAAAAVLFVLGARPAVVPSDHPATELGLLGTAATASVVAVAGTTSRPDPTTLAGQGWAVPQQLPDGWSVAVTRWIAEGVLEVVLDGPGSTVVLTEQQGRLDPSALADRPTRSLGGRTVTVLSYDPWTVVWQDGATVVEALAANEDDTVDAVVAGLPAAPYDDGVPARISRGWTSLSAAFRS